MEENKKNQTYTPGLVLGILSIPCGIIIAISGWILGIVGIVKNSQKKNEYNTTAGLILSIIGLVISVLNSILGIILSVGR